MEDSKIQIKAQASQLCKMLSKPDSQRMPFQGVQIAKSLQRIPFLQKFFDMKSQQFINLCITSNIVQFQPNTDIYANQYDDKYIYIILEGFVKVTLKNESIFQQGTHFLNQFGIFGQTQILFNLKQRKQRIVANNTIKCIIFPQYKIIPLLTPQILSFMQKSLKYLQVNQYFQELSQFEKQQLVLHLSYESYNRGDYLIEQGYPIHQVLFIIHGNLSIVTDLKLKDREKQKYKIDQLSEMNSFGQYQCVNNTKSLYDLVANTSGSYYLLDYESIKQLNCKILKRIKQRSVSYPEEQQISFLYDIKNSLNYQQEKIVKKNKLFY